MIPSLAAVIAFRLLKFMRIAGRPLLRAFTCQFIRQLPCRTAFLRPTLLTYAVVILGVPLMRKVLVPDTKKRRA